MNSSKKKNILITLLVLTPVIVFIGGFLLVLFKVEPSKYNDQAIWGIKGMSEVLFGLFVISFGLFIVCLFFEFSFRIWKAFMYNPPNRIMSTGFHVGKEFLEPDSFTGCMLKEVDDKHLVIIRKDPGLYTGLCVLGVLLFTILAIVFYNKHHTLEGAGAGYIALMFSFLIFLFIRVLHFTAKIRFNRLDGTVSIPGRLFFANRTVPFSDVIFDSKRVVDNYYTMRIKHPSYALFYYIPRSGHFIGESWMSFYLWYMDKNRPLPPGDLFDRYREADFKRRQAEGFPPPLYSSQEVISDDRVGFIICDDKVRGIIESAKVNIPVAYDIVNNALFKQRPDIKEEDVVLTGIWQDYYVFSATLPPHQPLKLFAERPENSFLVHKDKRKVKISW